MQGYFVYAPYAEFHPTVKEDTATRSVDGSDGGKVTEKKIKNVFQSKCFFVVISIEPCLGSVLLMKSNKDGYLFN